MTELSLEEEEERIIIPYLATPWREGNKLVRTFVTPFEDAVGNKANITKADFINKKGVLVEDYTLFVKWEN